MRPHLRMGRGTAVALLAACAVAAAVLDGPAPAGARLASARADDDWSAEFDAVCSRTQDAMTLSTDELQTLIRRADALKPKIDALDASLRKVYGKRLQLCRDLYAYVLESRKAEQSP